MWPLRRGHWNVPTAAVFSSSHWMAHLTVPLHLPSFSADSSPEPPQPQLHMTVCIRSPQQVCQIQVASSHFQETQCSLWHGSPGSAVSCGQKRSTHSSIAIQGVQGKGARSAVPLTVYGRAQGGEGHALLDWSL